MQTSGQFVFAYNISIENHSEKTVQLLRRHWIIKDSNGITKEVKGDGVIGEQPIIQPNRIHEYGSWAKIESEIGKMYGSYLMQDTDTKKEFEVGNTGLRIGPHRIG